ncbi:hypothetical protein [Desulfoscipio geothermicus]|uniref:Copper chaperone CopZ n=1 Tax=Desulfoscipio geothermicus DSM 3669 TaxID=1121426 RepID=A0A1I6D2C6_9FIRM|nr:hypothetical protein [Desulfoscipio geothermicus]SFQ99531.1 hypothetical protein SAMN05660706_104121 [Desulfoscipio geothermicus DSM 3669]
MERMIIQLNQKCPAASLPNIKDILRCKPGLRLSSFDVTARRVMISFNPTCIDADTIMEALLQKGYDIDYFCNVA